MTDQLDTKSPSMRLWHTLLAQGVSEDEATALMNGYAHELAERQRQHIRRLAAHPLRYGSAEWAIRGADEVADLIDPKKP